VHWLVIAQKNKINKRTLLNFYEISENGLIQELRLNSYVDNIRGKQTQRID
jgi:hypothetical protein